jgi:endoglucanase
MNVIKITIAAVLIFALTGPAAAASAEDSTAIRLNTVGYLPAAEKRASIAAVCSTFSVVRLSDGAKVLKGKTTGPVINADTGEKLWTADFSSLRAGGRYRLDVPGVGKSARFVVGSDVYAKPFRTVVRGMYLWRCGTAVKGVHGGDTFIHAACHMNDALLDLAGGGKHVRAKSTGGWHDAGDYNKYVVNAGVTVGAMFRAWDDFAPQIRKIALNIPESGRRTPDYLAEIKWEIDWLLTMQGPDGSVYHKLSGRKFSGMTLPERDRKDRFFSPWSSAATADFVAMTAAAGRYFRPYDKIFADKCLAAAEKSYAFLVKHPKNHRADLKDFSTGTYQTNDPDDRLWAAAELWETTGRADVLADCEARVKAARASVDVNWDWGNVRNLGMLTYLLSKRPGREKSLATKLGRNLQATADGIVRTGKAHGYARPLGSRYFWGCNGSVARQVLVLRTAYRLAKKDAYLAASSDAVNHLFGRNCYGRSFVTGLGSRPPMHPHDRRSEGDKVTPPWPGYLVGGPHPKAASWTDVKKDYRTNEIAINWNGALIYALASLLDATDR